MVFQKKTIKITLPVPPSWNSIYRRARHGGMYMTDRGRAWLEDGVMELFEYRGWATEADRVRIVIRLFVSRDIDWDNCAKLIGDLVSKHAGVIADDRQIVEAHVFKEKTSPVGSRVEVELSKLK